MIRKRRDLRKRPRPVEVWRLLVDAATGVTLNGTEGMVKVASLAFSGWAKDNNIYARLLHSKP